MERADAVHGRRELQADRGPSAPRQNGVFIEPGDVESALQTASAIGHERLQQKSQGYVATDAFARFGATNLLVRRQL
jgi:predicted metalloprotease